jgi:hypothetical protein
MKTYGRMDAEIPVFLISALADKWSASRLGHFTVGKDTTVLTGQEAVWAPEAVWMMWKGEKSYLHQDSNSNPSAAQPVVSRYSNCTASYPVYIL